MEPNININPFGAEPVLNSLILNSRVFIEDASASSENPSSTIFFNVDIMSDSTASTFSGFTSFKPTEYVAWRSVLENPPPVMADPRPLSINVFRKIDDGVPNIKWLSTFKVNSSVGVKGSSLINQFICTLFVSFPSPPLG